MFVACDESGINSSDKYLVIGSAWTSKQGLCDFERKVTELRLKHKCWGEVKWSKVGGAMSDEMFQFYVDFITLAFQEIEVCHRFIIVEKKLLDMRTYHNNSNELVQFKFFHLLISRYAERFLDKQGKKSLHIVFDDFEQGKKAKDEKWLLKTRGHIERHLGGNIEHLQPCISHICSLIQLCDLFTGAISTFWNTSPSKIAPKKEELIKHMEQKTGKKITAQTLPTEKNFNVWVWRPSIFKELAKK